MFRSRKWLINCRRDDIFKKDVNYLYNNVKLCSLHFEENQFVNIEKKKLVWNAVPTTFNVPNKPLQMAVKRKLPTRNDASICKPKKGKETSAEDVDYIVDQPECSNQDSSVYLRDENVAETMEEKIEKLKKTMNVLRRKYKYKSAEVVRLKQKCKVLKKCKCVCNSKRNVSKIGCKEAVKADRQKLKCIGLRYMTKEAVNVMESQITEPSSSKFGNRWNDEIKLFSLRNLYYIPQGYKFLCQYFQLPSVRTLQKYVEGIRLHCGINENIFQLLKEKVETLPEDAKIVNLSVDEMSIMCNLTYDTASDCIIGFEDFGFKRTVNVANSVLVFCVNGIFSNFNQTIAYFFTCNGMKAVDLHELFLCVLDMLKEIGLRVKSCVSDQGSNFIEWRNRLGYL